VTTGCQAAAALAGESFVGAPRNMAIASAPYIQVLLDAVQVIRNCDQSVTSVGLPRGNKDGSGIGVL
jgi:hypothetical protein